MNKELDPTDKKILNLLQEDARLELSTIAGRVYKSTSSVHERIRKLQEQGFIKKYVAVLDPHKIGRPFLAITQVTLAVQTHEALNGFAVAIGQLPEVSLCLQLSGNCDFILHVSVADAGTYHEFLMNTLCKLEFVQHVQTHIVLNECKANTPYLL